MNFSSKFVWAKKKLARRPEPVTDSAEDTSGLPSSRLVPPPPPLPASYQLQQNASVHQFTDCCDADDSPDTNVVTVKFNQLKEPVNMHAGDSIKCHNCDAFLSHISSIDEKSNTVNSKDKTWKCEFCNYLNNLIIDAEEKPKADDVTYLLQAAPTAENNFTETSDSEYIVYCIDISGSMSVTTEVRGDFQLPTDNLRKQRAEGMMDREDMPYVTRNRTRHITRLEAVQVAIEDNLTKLEKEKPEKKVGLITFNHEVCSYGDGTGEAIAISGDLLEVKESIEQKSKLSNEYKPIKETNAFLHEKLLNLEEGGATALGPALYYSILIASRKSGSQVILCTDGLANKGIGNFEDNANFATFYNELTTYAISHGVSVSIITLEGTTCKLGVLGELADKTGGVVNIVNPLNIKSEFAAILSEQIIATNVTAKFLLHKAMFVKDYDNLNNKQSVISKAVGNVTQDTEITFEFALREDADIDEKVIKELPFQLQIVYTAKDGSKALRVLTQLRPITNDKTIAEKNADRVVLATHAMQSNARMLQKGPRERSAFAKNNNKWNGYIKQLKNDGDEFSEVAYDNAQLRLNNISAPLMQPMYQPSNASNAYSDLNDEDASTGYKLKNMKSSFLKKK